MERATLKQHGIKMGQSFLYGGFNGSKRIAVWLYQEGPAGFLVEEEWGNIVAEVSMTTKLWAELIPPATITEGSTWS